MLVTLLRIHKCNCHSNFTAMECNVNAIVYQTQIPLTSHIRYTMTIGTNIPIATLILNRKPPHLPQNTQLKHKLL